MEHIATQLIFSDDLLHAFLRAVQRGNGGDLNRGEGTVIMVTLHFCQRGNQRLVTDHEADPPSCHVVAFGHGEELHRYIARAGDLHDRRRFPAVKGDVSIGQIVHHQHIVRLGQRNDAFKELQLHAHRGGIGGESQDQHFRFRIGLADGFLCFLEEIHALGHAHVFDLRTGNHRAVNMNWITRIGHQHRIATVECGQHQMRQSLLGSDGDNRLRVGIEFNIEAALVPIGNGFAQPGNALRHRVAMGVGPLRGFDEFIDDVLGCRPIRVSHRHVDDVFATPARRHFQFRRDIEDVRRKAFDAREFVVHVGFDDAVRLGIEESEWL